MQDNWAHWSDDSLAGRLFVAPGIARHFLLPSPLQCDALLAAHPELIDPMNDYESAGFNPMSIPMLDNGFSVVTQDNAKNFYWDKYLKKRGTRGIEG